MIMKKFIGIILGAAAVVACSKSSVEYSAPTELTLSPVTEVSKTKAAIDGTTFPTANIIGVYAFQKDLDPESSYVEFVDPATFLSNVQFSHDDGQAAGIWAGYNGSSHYPYYWPRTGSIILAGYSPYQSSGISYSFAADGTNVTKDSFTGEYSESTDLSKTVDLLWSPATKTSYSSGKVPMRFKHATSWLTFKAKSNDNATTITITGLTVTSVNTKGTFTTTGENIEWNLSTVASDTKNITVFSGSKPVTGEFEPVENASNGLLVLPQDVEDNMYANLSYSYTYNNGGTPITLSHTEPIQLNKLIDTKTNAYITEWEAGKHYILNIEFGASQEILIEPSVEQWVEVTASKEIDG